MKVSQLLLLLCVSSTAVAMETVENLNALATELPVPMYLQPDLVSDALRAAAQEGRLIARCRNRAFATQLEPASTSATPKLIILAPGGTIPAAGFDFERQSPPPRVIMQARQDADSGQILISEGDEPILQYNYQAIGPGALWSQIAEGNRIYARTRSDYIHPLYGLRGEVLTRDWAIDHPHHRGIYWAWPEVDYGSDRGDLHALQKVFARPTGTVRLSSGPVFAQVEAENEWHWDEREPIVRERTILRAYRSASSGRVVDLAFEFFALRDGVTVARRGTGFYGGLNVRMESPRQQVIITNTDPADAQPRRAWSDLSGDFGSGLSGLTTLQHSINPDYPGDWIQYPEISWVQPAFPAAKTRYHLSRTEPLVLRYRLWVHTGPGPTPEEAKALWDGFHHANAALLEFKAEVPEKGDK